MKICLMAATALLVSTSALAQETSPFAFLSPYESQAIETATQREQVYARLEESLAGQKSAVMEFLPYLGASGGIRRNENLQKKEGPLDTAEWTVTAGLNLFNKGADYLNYRQASLQTEDTRLNITEFESALRKALARDLLALASKIQLLEEKEAALGVWQNRRDLTQRKHSTGEVSAPALLEAEREVMSSSAEVENFRLELAHDIGTFNLKYGIRSQPLKREDLPNILANFEKILPTGVNALQNTETLQQAAMNESPVLKSQQKKFEIQELESRKSRYQTLLPSIDLSFSAPQENFVLGSSKNPDRSTTLTSQSWSANLSVSFSIFQPKQYGAITIQQARRATLVSNANRSLASLSEQIQELKQRETLTQQQKSLLARLLAQSNQILEGNVRLFEAGEISSERLIQAQQDVNRQRQTLLETEHTLRTVALEALFLQKLGYLETR